MAAADAVRLLRALVIDYEFRKREEFGGTGNA